MRRAHTRPLAAPSPPPPGWPPGLQGGVVEDAKLGVGSKDSVPLVSTW